MPGLLDRIAKVIAGDRGPGTEPFRAGDDVEPVDGGPRVLVAAVWASQRGGAYSLLFASHDGAEGRHGGPYVVLRADGYRRVREASDEEHAAMLARWADPDGTMGPTFAPQRADPRHARALMQLAAEAKP